jgi:hypothetical protein
MLADLSTNILHKKKNKTNKQKSCHVASCSKIMILLNYFLKFKRI